MNHQDNHFITLTYDDEHLPHDGSLNHVHFQKFFKRLRKSQTGKTIRFFMCGEYGEKLSRPHYHALVFGHAFNGLKKCSVNKHGDYSFTSPELTKLWGMGRCTIGQVNFKSAAYCSSYVMKKIGGKPAETHYARTDPETGNVYQLTPEYCTMSKKPGIGSKWANKYDTDIYPADYVIISGSKVPIPPYYDRLKSKVDPDALERIKLNRIRSAAKPKLKWNNTPERLAVRKFILKERLKSGSRSYETTNKQD